MDSPVIITLDGPAGVGKTTLAKALAQSLRLPCLDTGAMFRFLALKAGKADINSADLLRLGNQWQFSLQGTGADTRLLANGKPIGREIRTEEVSALASALASRPELRQILLEAQRQIGGRQSLVAEGRDLGTVVFPHAQLKFFLEANPEARALRRWREYQQAGKSATLEEIAKSMQERDTRDRERAAAPLKPAEDSIIVDTSDLTIPQLLELLTARAAPLVLAED